jgi:hypothetical protein
LLWTDGIFVQPEDLARIDSEVTAISTAEGITLSGDNGLLRGAVEEAASEMMKLIISFGGYLNSGDLTANHLAAVLNVGIGNSVRQKIGLQQIVVSGDVSGQWSWVKQWVVFWALRTFYRDAFSRLGGDRYRVKMDFYKDELQRRVTPNLWALGVPMVIRPLARPAAKFERNVGTWDDSNVVVTPDVGTGANPTQFDVVVTYADMSQANFYVSANKPNNSESNPSDVVTVSLDSSQTAEVDITSLNPPTGYQHPSQVMVVVVSPLKATHWNVYVGLHGKTLFLQNSSPLPISTKTFAIPANPILSGFSSDLGQYPDRRLSLVPTRQRA